MITEVIAKDEIYAAKELLYEAHSIAIVTHIGPDGDALGSSLGLYHLLKTIGKETVAVITPNDFPDFLKWMPGATNIINYEAQNEEADTIIDNTDLIVCLDFNTPSRTGKMGDKLISSKAKKLMIDHHLYPSDLAQVVISYPHISSTSELVFRLICRMGHFSDINLPCAECIYTGMMTDTGNFSYNSNQPEIYTIMAELLKKGVNKDQIYQNVFNHYSEGRMRLMGYCLYKKMKTYPQYHTALITLSGKELYPFNYQTGDTEGFVNMPLSIQGIQFSVLMREDKDKIKISLRSQGEFPCNELAAQLFNGGGHLNASGGESYTSLEEAIQLFEEALPAYFEKHKDKIID